MDDESLTETLKCKGAFTWTPCVARSGVCSPAWQVENTYKISYSLKHFSFLDWTAKLLVGALHHAGHS